MVGWQKTKPSLLGQKVMLAKVETKEKIKTWIRPYDPRRLARMNLGQIKGIRAKGYDVQIRKVKHKKRREDVTLAPQVRRELRVVGGDVIVWCWIDAPGMLAIAEEGALDERDVDGRPILGEVIARSKVREDTGSHKITVPKGAQIVLGNVIERFLDPGLTNYPGIVTVKVFETEVSACRLTSASTKVLRRWPVQVEDSTAAWLAGFEPIREAMANTWLPPRYARRDPRNFNRFIANYQMMIETAELQAELRRAEQSCSKSCGR